MMINILFNSPYPKLFTCLLDVLVINLFKAYLKGQWVIYTRYSPFCFLSLPLKTISRWNMMNLPPFIYLFLATAASNWDRLFSPLSLLCQKRMLRFCGQPAALIFFVYLTQSGSGILIGIISSHFGAYYWTFAWPSDFKVLHIYYKNKSKVYFQTFN